MVTKLPVTDNRVSIRRDERGIALISVVSVLVLLAIIATPFLVTMRDSAARGERFLYSARADWEAESLFELTRAHLTKSLEHVERRKLDELDVRADSDTRPPDDATPSADTLSEIELPEEMLARFNKQTAREQRVWDVEITDLQSKLNINACSYPVLANILGRTEVVDEIGKDDNSIPVADASMFPPEGGVVRIGSEVIKYGAILGNELSDCERGYKSELAENGGPGEYQPGDTVILEAAFQIATRPFRAREGAYVRYTNPYQARSIADQGVAALTPDQFDRLRPYITTWNGNVVGDGWSNPQVIRNGITPGDASQLYADIKNLRYFGEGTLVKITDGLNSDYAVVTKVRGNNQVLLAGNIKHDYSADQARIYSLARSPVNINTADVRTLALIFEGVRKRGVGSGISRNTARDLAAYLKGYTVEAEDNAGVFRNWEDFVKAIDSASEFGVNLADDEREAIIKNAMNANDSSLHFSTVPFCFRSFDVYEVRATAAIMDQTGRELSRRELRRVMVAASSTSGTYVVQSQNDFQTQIIKSRDGKWFATFPDNVNAYFDGINVPASEYFAFAQKDRFPSTDPSTAVGDVRLLPASFRYANRREEDRVYHFDESDLPDGLDLVEDTFEVGVDGPYGVEEQLADIVEFADAGAFGDDIEVGLKDFAVSFWYQPNWSRGEGDQVIFDYGLSDDHTNRVSLTYDDQRDMLVLAVADATREQRSTEIFYEFDHTTWEPDTWYHIAAHIGGSHASQLELFIDGEKQGQASGITRLTAGVPNQGAVNNLAVEDTEGFPDAGTVIIRGDNGAEIFEYSSKQENSFRVTRRKARSIDHVDDADELRAHDAGALVELYGFAGPLLTDIKPGGATVSEAFGPYRVYRFHYIGDILENDQDPNEFWRGLADPTSGQTLPITDVTLSEFTTGSTDPDILDDLGTQGARGIAMLISNAATRQALNPDDGSVGAWVLNGNSVNGGGDTQSNDIGSVEIIEYSVVNPSTGEIQIENRHLDIPGITVERFGGDQLNRFLPTYSFGDQGTGPDGPLAPSPLAVNTQQAASQNPNGAYTAFIPIGFVASGSGADYLNPGEDEPQAGGIAYVQVDSEWIKYDTFAGNLIPQRAAFLRTRRLEEVQNLFAIATTDPLAEEQLTVQMSPLPGQRGGSGGSAQGQSEPPVAVDDNNEDDPPTEPQDANAGTGFLAPTEDDVSAFRIAEVLDMRGMELRNEDEIFRIANTIPNDHAASENVIACFRVTHGNTFERSDDDSMRGAFPGFNDLLTLRDTRFNDEFVRVQWGYRGWVGLTQPTTQTWLWDRPDTADRAAATMRHFDSRVWTRVLKFPSGEAPDAALTSGSEKIRWGLRYDDSGGTTPAIIDEVFFPDFTRTGGDRPNFVYVGEVPQDLIAQQTAGQNNPNQQPVDPQFTGIDDSTDEIPCHFIFYVPSQNARAVSGLPISDQLFPTDGGIIRIDDELILFSDFDPERGLFTGCQRGTFGTQPTAHAYNAIISPIHAFPTSRLTSEADESSASFQLEDATDFPDDGYLRIADAGEVIGYTEREENELSGPLGRIDPDEASERIDDEARVGGGIFRGRFGTIPEGYSVDDVVVAMPFRHYDRYAEFSDDAENSYVQLSWTKPGAVWKRITWSDVPVEFVEVLALVRFSGGPAWDANEVVRVGQDPMPTEDRRKYLYEITDATAENLLNIEADRVEVRLMVRFGDGAYDRFAETAPDFWKQTPWIQKVVVEFVSPPAVIYEDK